ncbi:MAG: hypothetical protein ACLGI6_19640 [Gammaproteobacteria bacterium]
MKLQRDRSESSPPSVRKTQAPSEGGARLAALVAGSARQHMQRSIQQAIGAGRPGVVQGYFMLDGVNTLEKVRYRGDLDADGKRDFVWRNLVLRALLSVGLKAKICEEHKEALLTSAFSEDEEDFDAEAQRLLELQTIRERSATPLTERASPAAMSPMKSTAPVMSNSARIKHSGVTYERQDGSTTSFDSDGYTRGPVHREGKGQDLTTPKGKEAQTWTTDEVRGWIGKWDGTVALARHLAALVWPKLANTEEGRHWEVKFREMDRLVTEREGENPFIVIRDKKSDKQLVEIDRRVHTVAARKLLAQAILDGRRHPEQQQKVLFFDTLLKAAHPAYADPAQTIFDINTKLYKAGKSGELSMIMTHWRTFLYFDWILAEDVLNNASDA